VAGYFSVLTKARLPEPVERAVKPPGVTVAEILSQIAVELVGALLIALVSAVVRRVLKTA
jgi:hypothetical protein